MLARFLAHLRNQWMGALALFLVLSGGTAVALDGSNTVFTDDIVNDQVKSSDVRDDTLTGGGLTATDLRADSVGNSEVQANQITSGDVRDDTLSNGGLLSADVLNDSLTGADVAEQSLNGSAHKLVFESPVDVPSTPVKLGTVGPYTFRASCTSTTHDEVVLRAFANGPAGTAQVMEGYTVNDATGGSHVSRTLSIPANTNTEITELAGFSGGDGRIAGTAMIRSASTLIQVDYNGVAKHSSGSCLLYGTATKAT